MAGGRAQRSLCPSFVLLHLGVLAQIGGALHLNYARGTHFAALYDIRNFKLPFASEAYGRVKVLAGWCGLQVVASNCTLTVAFSSPLITSTSGSVGSAESMRRCSLEVVYTSLREGGRGGGCFCKFGSPLRLTD
jgi:hypothetical protein